MSDVYVQQDDQVSTKKAPYLQVFQVHHAFVSDLFVLGYIEIY